MSAYKPKSFEEIEKERIEKEAAARKRIEDIRLNTYNWMKNDAAIQQYLQQFSPFSQESFMQQYAHYKSLFTEYADSHAAISQNRDEGNIQDAQTRLMDIQLKKLFDIMLQWDAKLVNLEGIECSWDFFKWQYNYSQCPFLPPVTQREFELYMQYACSDAFEYNRDTDLLELSNIRAAEDEVFPEWILFENLRTGNNKYLVLPQLRSGKENFYRDLVRKEEDKKLEKKYATGELERPDKDTRPMAPSYYYRGIEDFVKRFENREVLSKFHAFYERNTDHLIRNDKEESDHGYLNERVETAIVYLADVREKIAVHAQTDWRLAVIEAYENYNRNLVRIGLQYAYNDYCLRLSTRTAYLTDEKNFQQMEGLANNIRNQVLRGRELNGEPRNFDY